ncbi:hypothetical protein GCM10011323_35530 [Pontibacter amylolyticus]|uniref:Uncharacterized protein n=2 Tax=Pontibacter amylolyticus TaxID=1424080 RepID=A0ABQ1WGV1_9BACT|nr:hypothetical protein GCM10011323_35530 [Pontibacter amylolyticus]
MLVGNTTIEGYPAVNDVLGVIGAVLFFTILIAYGHYLYDYLPRKVELSYNLFIINAFLTTATLIAVAVLTESNEVSFTGIYALPGFYISYAFLHTIAFPVKVLKSIELNREAKFGEYIALFFGIIFWPFCIWFIQPRVNRIAREEQAVIEV